MLHYAKSDTGPSPVFGMSAKALARWAFDVACARLQADAKAGRIPADAALIRFNRLRGAYQTRKQNIEQRAFVERAMGRG